MKETPHEHECEVCSKDWVCMNPYCESPRIISCGSRECADARWVICGCDRETGYTDPMCEQRSN